MSLELKPGYNTASNVVKFLRWLEDNKDGEFHLSVQGISNKSGVSLPTVRKYVLLLEEHGFYKPRVDDKRLRLFAKNLSPEERTVMMRLLRWE